MLTNKKYTACIFPLVLLVGSVSIFAMEQKETKITIREKYTKWKKEQGCVFSIPNGKEKEIVNDILKKPDRAVLVVDILKVHPDTHVPKNFVEFGESSVFGFAVYAMFRNKTNENSITTIIKGLLERGGNPDTMGRDTEDFDMTPQGIIDSFKKNLNNERNKIIYRINSNHSFTDMTPQEVTDCLVSPDSRGKIIERMHSIVIDNSYNLRTPQEVSDRLARLDNKDKTIKHINNLFAEYRTKKNNIR